MNAWLARGARALAPWLMAARVWAQDAEDSALQLADETPEVTQQARAWRVFVEGSLGGNVRRMDGATQDTRRASLDIQFDHSPRPVLRLFLADRLDISSPAAASGEHAINTLKEAYASLRPTPSVMADLGRINVRNGVAFGYNPTDFLRAGSLRSVVSIAPMSLKENRQGSVMLRGQKLWEGGSLTALYSPRLRDGPDREGFNLDVGATNSQDRWLIALSQTFAKGFAPQFLLYDEEASAPKLGLNVTGLLSDSTVVHVEWAGGRALSQRAQALRGLLPVCECAAWRNRAAAGLTHTTAAKLSLTLEYHYNGAAADESEWNALRHGPLLAYGAYRDRVQDAQEMPTRQALFLFGLWQDALVHDLDLSLMVNHDLVDASRRVWVEALYHRGQFDFAVQWQRSRGTALSNYGAMPEARAWQFIVRYYL